MSEVVPCTKAIIATAGNGTRYETASFAYDKPLIALLAKPVLQYVVEDLYAAGVTDFTFVVKHDSDLIKKFFSKERPGERAATLNDFIHNTTRRYIKQYVSKPQPAKKPYGTSVPLSLAFEALNDKERYPDFTLDGPFLYLYGDNVYYDRKTHQSMTREFLKAAQTAGAPAAMVGVEVPRKDVIKYGIIDTEMRDGLEFYKHIVEKPTIETAPASNLNNGGVLLLTKDIKPFVERSINEFPNQKEKQLTDALNLYVEQPDNRIFVHRTPVPYWDCGTPESTHAAASYILGQ